MIYHDLSIYTVRENIMTGMRFWGCKCCGVYDRHNEVVQSLCLFQVRAEVLWLIVIEPLAELSVPVDTQ